MVEQSAQGILELQEGQRKYYNSAWLETTGYSSEDHEPIPFLSLVHPDDVERIEEAYHRLALGSLLEPVPDFRIFTKSGEVKWLSISSANI
jgi:PAS domain S-box-containing protein